MSIATKGRVASEGLFPVTRAGESDETILTIDVGEGEDLPAHMLAGKLYTCVTTGLIAISRLAPSGRRQILFLAFPGDWVAIPSGLFVNCQATALIPSTVVSSSTLNAGLLVVAGDIGQSLIEQSRRLAEHSFRLGALSAMEAIALFIDQMKKRQGNEASNEEPVRLYLNRVEIADYLGLTVETVSRTFSKLKRREFITFSNSKQVDMLRPSIFAAVCEDLKAS